MLPFLQDKKQAVAAIMGRRNTDGSMEMGNPDGSSMDGKLEAASELLKALHAKDAKGVMEALESIFELYDNDENEGESNDES